MGTGTVAWKASSKEMPLNCAWSIIKKDDTVTKDSILGCTDKGWCEKNYQISMFESLGATDPANKKAFVSGQSYTINFICSKDVPNASYYSDIKSVALSIPNKPDDNKKSDITPTAAGYLSTNVCINFIMIMIVFLF